ncbi:MAG: hypothetical protein M3Y35_03365 [Actinomycetota bacterium]|nr:hypothetical protein [Actinomycetota bacterium]
MTNVFSYFGIQDVHDLADRVLKGDANDLGSRAKMCTQTAQTVQSIATDLQQLSDQLFQSWTGVGADAARAKMAAIIEDRHRQADQLTKSADAFTRCDHALLDVQRQAREIVAQAEAAGRALDTALHGVQLAMDAMTGGGALGWVVKKATGVDIEAEGRTLLMAAIRPIYETALGLLARMEAVIRDYEKVLLDQAAVLRGMPGIVRTDAGPVDLPGDADLRRGALFESVYGHPPETANDKLMAEALDMQGDDTANTDPNSHLVVTHITPVPGAGVVHGAAFISIPEVANPQPNDLNQLNAGDNRGFDPNADPSKSRMSYYIDYERGIVVVRQNASHSDHGGAATGNPSVGIEEDPAGRVRLRIDGTDPLAIQVGQDLKASVRGDLIVDPHGGQATATINGNVTRFPSWEAYQTQNGAGGTPVLQRQENAPIAPTPAGPIPLPSKYGPMVGLPQATVPVGDNPSALGDWVSQYHPQQVNAGPSIPTNLPELTGDDFYKHPLPNVPYPTVDSNGRLAVPNVDHVG